MQRACVVGGNTQGKDTDEQSQIANKKDRELWPSRRFLLETSWPAPPYPHSVGIGPYNPSNSYWSLFQAAVVSESFSFFFCFTLRQINDWNRQCTQRKDKACSCLSRIKWGNEIRLLALDRSRKKRGGRAERERASSSGGGGWPLNSLSFFVLPF